MHDQASIKNDRDKAILWPLRWVLNTSNFLLKIERKLLTVTMTLLLLLVMLNVVTRYTGMPIYWVDEASVYTMVWMTFIGASVMTRLRMDFAVTMITDKLSPNMAQKLKALSTFFVFLFACALVWMCWNWMDPIGVIQYGFDVQEYAANSFNFLYTERTQTLNWPVWMIQLTIPLFAVSLTIHALCNLCEELCWLPRRQFSEFPVTTPDMVN